MNHTMTRTSPVRMVVAAWAALSLFLNAQGVFETPPDRPPLPLLAAVLVPPLLFLVAYATSANARAIALGLDLRLLTAMQAWRIIGAMFLVLMSFRLLPGTFAWEAGVGDMIVGIYAPFAAVAVARRTPGWQKQVVLLNLLGLIDFIGAIGGGVLSGGSPIGILHGEISTDIMQQMPLSLIPTFAVPFWIVLHLISLIQVSRLAAEAVPAPA